jgi:Tfp pilus assembly protein PilN
MIRIDLGKGEGSKKKLPAFLENIQLPPWMPDINRIRDLVSGKLSIFVAIAIACLFPLIFSQYRAFVTSQYTVKQKAINDKIDELTQEVAKFAPFQAELNSYEKQKKVISERLAIVRQLLEARNTPVSILDTIGQSLPSSVWVDGIELNLKKENPSLTLKGRGSSNEDVSDFVEKLSESVHLSEVNLDDVAEEVADKVDQRAFAITARPRVNGSTPGGPEIAIHPVIPSAQVSITAAPTTPPNANPSVAPVPTAAPASAPPPAAPNNVPAPASISTPSSPQANNVPPVPQVTPAPTPSSVPPITNTVFPAPISIPASQGTGVPK